MAVRITVGDAREKLAELPDESVHMVITSPPYWGLRSYGGEVTWEGGDPDCDHDAGETEHQKQGATSIRPGRANVDLQRNENFGRPCLKCGAVPRYNGMIGLEETLDEHLDNLVQVFREVRRVLRKDGVLFLNYGDAYARGSSQRGVRNGTDGKEPRDSLESDRAFRNLCGECEAYLRRRNPDRLCRVLGSAAEGQSSNLMHTESADDRVANSGSALSHETGEGHQHLISQPDADVHGARASNTEQSSPRPLGECSQERNLPASEFQSSSQTSTHDAPRSVCTVCGLGIDGTSLRSPSSHCRTSSGPSSSASQYSTTPHFKPKDLMGLPWRIAFALQADGWWLRSDICWHKSNPMPESAKDRPTRAHEFLFMLTKAPRYFYDHEAVKEPVSGTANARAAKHNTAEARRERAREGTNGISTAEVRGTTLPKPSSWATSPHYQNQNPRYAKRVGARTPKDVDGRSARLGRAPGWRERDDSFPDPRFKTRYDKFDRPPGVTPKSAPAGSGIRQNESYHAAMVDQPATRNLRDVWQIASAPFKGAHFATFPPALCEMPIRAGTSEHGVCSDCGAPWERVVEVSYRKNRPSAGNDPRSRGEDRQAQGSMSGHHGWRGNNILRDASTVGFRPTCKCYDERYRADHPEPKNARKREQRAAWPGRWKRVRGRPGKSEWPVESAVVLDPFGGAGTVGLVAERLGRDSILIEINADYAAMAQKRIDDDVPPKPAEEGISAPRVSPQLEPEGLPLFAEAAG